MKKFISMGLILLIGIVMGLGISTQVVWSKSVDLSTEIRRVTEQVRILNLLNNLELSREQAKFILGHAEDAQQIRNLENYTDAELTKTLSIFQDLRSTLIASPIVSAELKKDVGKATTDIEKFRLEGITKIEQLAREIEGILKPHQLKSVEDYKACFISPKPGAAGQVTTNEFEVNKLVAMKKLPNPKYALDKEQLAAALLEHNKKYIPKDRVINEDAEIKWIVAIFDKARNMSDADFIVSKSELADQIKNRYAPPKLAVNVPKKIETFLLNPEIIPILKSKYALASPFNKQPY